MDTLEKIDTAKLLLPHFTAIIKEHEKAAATGEQAERERVKKVLERYEDEYMKKATDTKTLGAVTLVFLELRKRLFT